MNETLKKQVDDASYAFYDNSIYKIVKATPKLNKLIMCECDIRIYILRTNINTI